MSMKARHPAFTAHELDWQQMRDCFIGQRAIKARREYYLPPTSGMVFDGMNNENEPGYQAYDSYLARAFFPDEVRSAVDGLTGIMHRQTAKIEVPPKLQPALPRLTVDNETADSLLRKINEAQLIEGRIGIVADVPTAAAPNALPFAVVYNAKSIVNWSTFRPNDGPEEFEFVVLDETGPELSPGTMEWKEQEIYRVLALAERLISRSILTAQQIGYSDGYVVGEVRGSDLNLATWVQPSLGGRVLKKIPFTVVNGMDLNPYPDTPPLLGLSHLALAIYRGEADYRQALFLQGQETLVVIGAEEELNEDGTVAERRIGAGAKIDLPEGGDAKYVGVAADGLGEMRSSLDSDYKKAGERGMRLMDTSEGGGQQSGDALRQRIAAKTASLVGIAVAGAAGLASVLKHMCLWMGVEEKVRVDPSIDFANAELTGREALDWTSAKQMGFPVSQRTLHKILEEREMTELTFEEELAEIADEEPLAIPPPTADTGETSKGKGAGSGSKGTSGATSA